MYKPLIHPSTKVQSKYWVKPLCAILRVKGVQPSVNRKHNRLPSDKDLLSRPFKYYSIHSLLGRYSTPTVAILASTLVTMPASAATLEEQEELGLTLYGTIDIGMASTRASEESTEKGFLSGGQTDSFWGLRGRESLSEDSFVMFALESGVDLANGRLEDPDRLFNYQSWLGLSDKTLGELRVGRQNTVGQAFVSEIEVGSWKDFGMGALMRSSDNYQVSNQISWRSPQWAGAQLGASYSFDEGEADTHTRSYSLAARYESAHG